MVKTYYEQLKRVFRTVSVLVLMVLATALFIQVWARHYNAMIVFPYYFKGFCMMSLMYFLLISFLTWLLDGSQIGYLRRRNPLLSQSVALIGTNLFFYMVTDLLATFLVPVWWFLIMTVAGLLGLTLLSDVLNRIYNAVFPQLQMLLVYGDYPDSEIRRMTAGWTGKYRIKDVISIKKGRNRVIRMVKDYDAVVLCDIPVADRNFIAEYCREAKLPTYFTPRVSDMLFHNAESLRFFEGHKGTLTVEQQFSLIGYLKKVWKKGQSALFEAAVSAIENREKMFIVTANPETLMTGLEAVEYNAILLDEGVVVIPDGIGLIKALKISGYGNYQRIPGVEFTEVLLKLAEIKGAGIFLYGSSQRTIDEMVKKIHGEYPHIRVLGAKNGYDHDPDEVMEEAAALRPDIMLVALGVPAQENLIARHLSSFEYGIFMGVGGSLDVLSGCKKRAPGIFIKLNLEWLYRIMKEAGRLGRFWNNNVRFLWEVLMIRRIK